MILKKFGKDNRIITFSPPTYITYLKWWLIYSIIVLYMCESLSLYINMCVCARACARSTKCRKLVLTFFFHHKFTSGPSLFYFSCHCSDFKILTDANEKVNE